jgi:DNA-binding winged helix-turn-helix (wHTH) protein/Flp pilus assembly protein TadD
MVRFGPFETDLRTAETRKYGIRVKLGGQPTAILMALLERPGEVVSRDELRERLWAQNTFVEFENGLNSAIKKLRSALGDSADAPLYVETVPRFGYRFIAPVQAISGSAADRSPAGAESAITDHGASAPLAQEEAGRRGWVSFLWISVVLIVVFGAYFAWSSIGIHRHPPTTAHADSGAVATSVARVTPSALSPRFAEAQDLYLKGMYFWNKRNVAGFQQAIEYFHQATVTDPTYALAYSGLANSYTLLTAYTSSPGTLYAAQARAAAARALKLDPNLAEAHTAMALIVENYDWDWRNAEREYRRAIELNPNYATAHEWYAELLMWQGRFDEALRESAKAHQLDPLSLIVAADRGAIFYYSRHYDDAIEQLRSVLLRDPNFDRALGIIIYAYVQKGMFSKALAEADVVGRIYGDGPWYWSNLAYVYGREGQTEQARRELEKLKNLSRHGQLSPDFMICAHLGMGEKEEAFADLESAYDEHYNLTNLKVEPAFDPLRSDPRFQDLLRRLNLN